MDKTQEACAHLRQFFEASAGKSGTVLFLCDADGGTVFDLSVANSLIRMLESWLDIVLPLSSLLSELEELLEPEADELSEVEVLSFWFCHWYSALV